MIPLSQPQISPQFVVCQGGDLTLRSIQSYGSNKGNNEYHSLFTNHVYFTEQNSIMMYPETRPKTGFVLHSFLLTKALHVCEKSSQTGWRRKTLLLTYFLITTKETLLNVHPCLKETKCYYIHVPLTPDQKTYWNV